MQGMAATRTHPYGDSDDDVSPAALDELVGELHMGDDEHFGVSVEHETGWCLTAYPSGVLVWEDVESDGPTGHRRDVPVAEVRRLFRLLADGNITAIHALGWQPGYSA